MEADMSTRATAEAVSIIWDGRMAVSFRAGVEGLGAAKGSEIYPAPTIIKDHGFGCDLQSLAGENVFLRSDLSRRDEKDR